MNYELYSDVILLQDIPGSSGIVMQIIDLK
jgi:hypothetical protein